MVLPLQKVILPVIRSHDSLVWFIQCFSLDQNPVVGNGSDTPRLFRMGTEHRS